MRTRWEALHTSLTRSIRTTHATETFDVLRRESPVLHAFADPTRLVAAMTTPTGDLDVKDSVIAALVAIVRRPRSPAESRLARSLVSLSLWPGLDAYYRRCLRRTGTEADELAAAIMCAFAEAVKALDTEGGTRPAATLIWNTERRIWDARRKARRVDALMYSLDELEERQSDEQLACGTLLAATKAEEREPERFWVTLRVADVELVVRVVLWGETQRQIARHLGVTEDAARKRYQRALQRLREIFQMACPTLPETTAFEGESAAEDAGR